jgi:hypothetical protein
MQIFFGVAVIVINVLVYAVVVLRALRNRKGVSA